MAILNFIKNLFARSSQGAHVPHTPMPPGAAQSSQPPTAGVRPVERHFERQVIAGIGMAPGWEEQAVLDQDDQLVQGRENLGYLAGCGHVVGGLQAVTKEDRKVLGVGGRCPHCQQELEERLKKGEVTQQEAEIASLYCSDCGAVCGGCGRRNLCSRHCLPFEAPDGTLIQLCPDCRTVAGRQKLVSQIARSLLLPFTDQPESQDTQEQENE